MHIAYIHPSVIIGSSRVLPRQNRHRLRRRAYLTVCKKYEHEIRAIQQYQPGWVPKF